VRGLAPYPAAWSILRDKSGKEIDIKIFSVKPSDKGFSLAPGCIEEREKRMFAGTGDGALEILSLQPAGKKRMEASAFLLGYHPECFIN
ncbi:MAG: methionyl-tRNA formyltransferase, partial [Muribaculaceae bacterium]|nr:methionyl-tRNA formyltransferase [Muribaculaceae bacterium]